MTKTNKIRSVLALLAVACGVGLPLVSAAANGCFDKPTPAPVAPADAPAPVADVPAPPLVVDVAPVTIVGDAHAAARKGRGAARKAHAKPACRLVPLEQGGSPAAPFVLSCG